MYEEIKDIILTKILEDVPELDSRDTYTDYSDLSNDTVLDWHVTLYRGLEGFKISGSYYRLDGDNSELIDWNALEFEIEKELDYLASNS